VPDLSPQVAGRRPLASVALAASLLLLGCQPAPAGPGPDATAPAAADAASDATTVGPPPHGRFVPPGTATLAYPTRAASAEDGVVYLSDPEAGAVFGYRDGRRVAELAELDRPLGVAVHGRRLFVGCAGRGAVEVYDLDARAWVVDLGGGLGEVTRPNAIAVAPDGVIYVADSDADLVAVFAADGYARVGSLGGPGELRFPVAVAVDATRVVVADQGHHRLRLYDRAGAPIASLGREVPLSSTSKLDFRGGFTRLQGVALWQGEIFALDAHHGHVQVLDRDGAWRAVLGRRGACPTCVDLPLDVQVAASGHVIVTDPERQRWVDLGPAAEGDRAGVQEAP